ncbi:MAG: hypothetical protein GYB31_01555 [Bacteroidetes bacterium]|nr:hypothetical protein [Bacteroidota bacterium]
MRKIYIPLVSLIVLFGSCSKDEVVPVYNTPPSYYTYNIPLVWNQLFLEVERFSPGYRPPVSARSHALINFMAYESIVAGTGGEYNSLSGQYAGLSIPQPESDLEYNWEVCLNAAYEMGFELFFPIAPAEQQFLMLDVGHALRAELQEGVSTETYNRSVEYGQTVAQAIYNWSTADEWGHESYLSNTDPQYAPPSGDGLWEPTYPDFLDALLPHWGKVKTFAALSTDEVPPPPSFSADPSSPLY